MLFGSVGYGQSDPPVANSGGLDFKQFGLLAIQEEGRRKPIDTFAREMLIRITGRSAYTDKAGRKWQPNDFVLSALLDTRDWKNEPMILISSGQLIEQLGLDKTQRRFSFAQLIGSAELQRVASEARALKRAEKPLDRVQQEALSVNDRLALLGNVMNGNALLIVPSPQSETDAWMVPDPGAVATYYNEAQFAPAFAELTKMMRAYTQADTFNFSSAARELQDNLRALSPSIYPQQRQLRLEYFYNHFEGFYRAIWCYGIALVILIAAHLGKRGGALQTVGVGIALLGLTFQASGIVMRCLIAGRPPVTNMYESIIWVSFAVSLFGMIFFARYRTPIYLLAALPVTLIALLLVHQMPIAMPSSIDPLVPVLRDNFWLTIHVLTITLSYAAFALAMGAKSGSRARERPDAFLALPRASARCPVARGRHNSRWSLGKLFLGQILGMGPKGDMGIDCFTLLPPGVARPAGGLVDSVRPRSGERGLFSRCVNGLVWRELCAGQRSA